MAVTYTKSQREYAKSRGLRLVTMSVPGLDFQGPTTEEECNALRMYMHDFIQRRSAKPPQAVTREVGDGHP